MNSYYHCQVTTFIRECIIKRNGNPTRIRRMHEVRKIAYEFKIFFSNPISGSRCKRHIRISHINLYGLLREDIACGTIERNAGNIARLTDERIRINHLRPRIPKEITKRSVITIGGRRFSGVDALISANRSRLEANRIDGTGVAFRADSANVSGISRVALQARKNHKCISRELRECGLPNDTYFPLFFKRKRSMLPCESNGMSRNAIHTEAVNSLARSRCGERYRTPNTVLFCTSRTYIEVIGSLILEAIKYQTHGRIAEQCSLRECGSIERRSRKYIAEIVLLFLHKLSPCCHYTIGIYEVDSKVLHRHTVSKRRNGIHRPRTDAIIMSTSVAISAYVDIMFGFRRESVDIERERIDTRILRSYDSRIGHSLRRNEYIVISYVIAE